MNILEFLEQRFDVESVDKNNVSIPCPNPDCENPGDKHFQVSLKRPYCHCFRCDYASDWYGLVMHVANVSYYEARHILDDIPIYHKEQKTKREWRQIELPPKTAWTKRSRGYLRDRGVTDAAIRQFDLYFCGAGYFKNRIIVPIFHKGVVVNFQARTVTNHPKRYLFPKGGMKPLYKSVKICYDETVVLVEGPFDVIRLWQEGYNAVGTFGKTITDTQIELLQEMRPKEVLLCRDSDVWDLEKEYERLIRFFDVSIAVIPEGDPADYSDIKSVIENRVSTPLEAKMMRMELA